MYAEEFKGTMSQEFRLLREHMNLDLCEWKKVTQKVFINKQKSQKYCDIVPLIYSFILPNEELHSIFG